MFILFATLWSIACGTIALSCFATTLSVWLDPMAWRKQDRAAFALEGIVLGILMSAVAIFPWVFNAS